MTGEPPSAVARGDGATLINVPGGGRVLLLGTVQGLASEAERVRAAFARWSPSCVALGTSVEGVSALFHHLRREVPKDDEARRDLEEEQAEALSDSDVGYGFGLARFGDVKLPPRCYLTAVQLARDHGLPVEGVDFTEEQYEGVFTREMGAFALWRYSRIARRLARAPPEAESAQAFALAWDAALLDVKAYAAVERAREAEMAKRAAEVARQNGSALVVVEAAREAGVAALLQTVSRRNP